MRKDNLFKGKEKRGKTRIYVSGLQRGMDHNRNLSGLRLDRHRVCHDNPILDANNIVLQNYSLVQQLRKQI